MKEIKLTRGKVAIVDDEDYERLSMHSWHSTEKGYAATTVYADGKRISVRMHRMLMGLGSGDSRQVDHINGNRADNRRSNLRICTASENSRNRALTTANKSGIKGVYFYKPQNKWRGEVEVEGSVFMVGTFNTPEEARDAVRKKRIELHGEFANHGNGR